MTAQKIVEKPLGKIQIHLKGKDTVKGTGIIGRLNPKQLYREIVQYAKDDNLMNAAVYQTHSGYSLHGKINIAHVELDNADLVLCVELIDEKPKLEEFCRKHAEILKGKLIVYKAVEFWEIK
jgi:PII-like signaling protein